VDDLTGAIEFVRTRRVASGVLVGYTAGVFDLFHAGHMNYLSAARAECEFLIVGVDCNERVRSKKGITRPVQDLGERLHNVQNAGLASYVFAKTTSADVILPKLQPNMYFIPSNRNLSPERRRLLVGLGIELRIISYTEGISTTGIADVDEK
jgi:glycerol-3-phosphate cytidylyltransferase